MEATNGQGYAAQLCVPDCRSRLAEAQTFSQMAYNAPAACRSVAINSKNVSL